MCGPLVSRDRCGNGTPTERFEGIVITFLAVSLVASIVVSIILGACWDRRRNDCERLRFQNQELRRSVELYRSQLAQAKRFNEVHRG